MSVVTPTYKDHNMIDRAEESIRNQTYENIEWVIVDSSGEDHVSDRADVYIHQQPQGVSVARNKGIEEAAGDYIAFLDADDWFAPKKIEECIETGGDFIYTDAIDIESTTSSYRKSFTFPGNEPPHIEFFRFDGVHGNIATSSIVVRRSLLGNQRFDPSLIGGEDYHLWIRLLSKTSPTHIQKPLVYIRLRNNSLSSNHHMMCKNRLLAVDKLASDFDEIASYVDERKQLERYSYGRNLLKEGQAVAARSILAEALRKGRYQASVLWVLTFLPKGHQYVVETLDKLLSYLSR